LQDDDAARSPYSAPPSSASSSMLRRKSNPHQPRAFGGMGAERKRIYRGWPRCFLSRVALNSRPRKCRAGEMASGAATAILRLLRGAQFPPANSVTLHPTRCIRSQGGKVSGALHCEAKPPLARAVCERHVSG